MTPDEWYDKTLGDIGASVDRGEATANKTGKKSVAADFGIGYIPTDSAADPTGLLGAVLRQTQNGDRFDAVLQAYLQQLNRDEDFKRSTPQQQVARLMAAGFSRAAALQSVSGAQYTAAQPFAAGSVEATKLGRAQLGLDALGSVGDLVGQASSIANQWYLGVKQGGILDLQQQALGLDNANVSDNRNAQKLYGRFSVLKDDYDRSHPDRPLPADIGSLFAELGHWEDPSVIQDDSLRNLAQFYQDDMRESLRSNPFARLIFRNMFDAEYASSWFNDASKRNYLRNFDKLGIELNREATALQTELINLGYQDQQKALEIKMMEEQIDKWKAEIKIGQRNAAANELSAAASAKNAETGVLAQQLNERKFSLQYSLSQPELEYAQLKIDALYTAYADGRQDIVDQMASQMRNDARLQDTLTAIEVMKSTSESDFLINHPHLAGISSRARILHAYGDYAQKFLTMRKDLYQGSMYMTTSLKNGVGAMTDLIPGQGGSSGVDPADVVPMNFW